MVGVIATALTSPEADAGFSHRGMCLSAKQALHLAHVVVDAMSASEDVR
jgi:hypothetical protein